MRDGIKVLAFDTFGTVADWHTGVSEVLHQLFPQLDSSLLAREWRRTYSPALAEVESGTRPWTLLDQLHRETLDNLLRDRYQVHATAQQLDAAVHAWHVIPGWPDSSEGLRRLRDTFTVCSLSNGNVALLTEMSKRNGFAWDFIGGSDLWKRYKPAPAVYMGFTELLQVTPHEVMMIATHSSDLAAASACGLRTAFIERPREWGPEIKPEAPPERFDYYATSVIDLADQLGCTLATHHG